MALRAIMAGEEDDAKQRLQRFIHSLDWAALTTLEQLIKTRKKTLKLSRELEASLQEEWDTEHPDGVNGMRRVFKVVEGQTTHTDVAIRK